MSAVTVQVTQADIDDGVPGAASACPIANALYRVLADPYRECVEVEELQVVWAAPVPYHLDAIPLPHAAIGFIVLFDNLQPVEPFAFTLDIPDDLLASFDIDISSDRLAEGTAP